MANPVVALGGASGDLGFRIARALIDRGAHVRALVRSDVSPAERTRLETIGLDLTEAHPRNRDAPGQNRNFDLRRDFIARADKTPIKVTSIFNGAFSVHGHLAALDWARA